MALDPFDILPVIKGEDSGSWFCYGTASVGLPSHSRQRDGVLEVCTLYCYATRRDRFSGAVPVRVP